MRKTVLTHFYNEEFLLPWWLKHHRDIFDWGVCINYGSTDRSVEVIKDICPNWVVVDSINDMFDARLCDEEVTKYEKQIPGWKTTLNVTEFLVGNFSILNDIPNQELKIPCHVMIDCQEEEYLLEDRPLIEQRYFGLSYKHSDKMRRPRCIHNKVSIAYPLGRHFEEYNCEEIQVLWYGWSPFNKRLIDRKLQIQNKIPESDKQRGFGREHITTLDKIVKEHERLKYRAQDLSLFMKVIT